jgi:hypothetical protein
MAANPNFKCTIGSLSSSIQNDINKRQAKYANYNPNADYSDTGPNKNVYNDSGDRGTTPKFEVGRPAMSPGTAMQLQNPDINPGADVGMEQQPPNIENNWQQAPLDVQRPPIPDQQAMLMGAPPMEQQQLSGALEYGAENNYSPSMMQNMLGNITGGGQSQSQGQQPQPTAKTPREVNQLAQLGQLYPQKIASGIS